MTVPEAGEIDRIDTVPLPTFVGGTGAVGAGGGGLACVGVVGPMN
jgi:hypothetical protein